MHPARGEPVMLGGTATTTPERVYIVNRRGKETFSRETRITNVAASGNIVIGVGGTAALAVVPGGSFVLTGHHSSFTIAASTGTVLWTAIAAAA
jgi:hypothetical protein